MVEFNQIEPGEPRYLQGFGGDTSNAIIAAARTGVRAAYVTRLGDDEFGRKFLALWREEGVATDGVAIDPRAHTAAYFVTHGPQSHAFSYLRTGSAASRQRPEDLPLALVRGARYVHASGISMAISDTAADSVLAAFEAGRAAGASISFDPNLRLKLWPLPRARALIAAAAGLSDCFFPSLDDAQALTGLTDPDAILDWGHRLGARYVFLKLGSDGSVVSDGTRRERIPALKVNAVDATGAGDCYCGAALARLASGDSIWQAARYANNAAALATTGFGAVAPLPRPEAVWPTLAGS
jgi:2-dehydro-3-deoxygluconokinase